MLCYWRAHSAGTASNVACMCMFVCRVSAGPYSNAISQLEHLNALWVFAADLHHAPGDLLLLYKILLCMSIKSSITRIAACQVSVHGHVMLIKPVLTY